MDINDNKKTLLRMLPGVDHILEHSKTEPFFENIPKSVLVRSIRNIVDDLRNVILDGRQNITENDLTEKNLIVSKILKKVIGLAENIMSPNLMHTINATGVVVHTNLGRSLLSTDAVENLLLISGRYSNLEFDLSAGKRGIRYSCVEDILCELSGAESAMVVNNNAGAVLLCLETIARGKKVVVSRGELVEIGG